MNKPIKVLYVDDERALLEIGKAYLEKLGKFQVSTLLSARDALTHCPIQTFDAIVSDFEMPEMNGIEFLKKTRELYGDIPFILFTGRGREEVVIEALNNGADFYLQKGVDCVAQFTELVHKINLAVKRKRTEEKLSLLEISIEQSYDEVYWIDFEGNILYANEKACKATGYSRDELINMDLFTLSPDLPRSLWNSNKEKMRTEKTLLGIARHLRKDGTFNDVEILANYVKKGDNEYSFAFVRDITEMKKKEEALHEKYEIFHSIVSQSRDGITIIDITGKILYANQCFSLLLGESEEITPSKNLNLFSFLLPESQEKLSRALQETIKTNEFKADISMYSSNGGISFHCSAKKISYQGSLAYILTLQDKEMT